MFLIELFDGGVIQDDPKGYRSEKDDNSSLRLSDLRKTRLTLNALNKLRVMNDIRKIEHEKKLKDIKNQYSVPEKESSSPF